MKCWIQLQQFIFQTSIVKQLELRSLWNLEACLVSWLEMHFCKKNQHVWENNPDRGRASSIIS